MTVQLSSGARARRAARNEPRPYDFRRSTKLSRKHVRSLEIVFDTFARQWSTLFTSGLRTLSTVNLSSIEELTYDEYIGRLGSPTMINVLTTPPLSGVGMLEVPLPSALLCVERLLGGPGTASQPERSLTDIEVAIVSQLLTPLLGELRYAFEPITHLEPEITAIEHNPQFVQAAAPTDVFIVASFELRIGESEQLCTLCLPFASLFPQLEIAIGADLGKADSEREIAPPLRVHDRLPAVPIEVAVGLSPTTLTPRTLIALKVGDVLRLGHKVTAPLNVSAAGQTFAHAAPGSQGQQVACQIVPSPPDHQRPSIRSLVP